jgi:hypothetical protein
MKILLIEHNYKYKQFPYLFWESRLVNQAGQYVKISSQNTTQANAFQAVCPKDKDEQFIPTHIIRGHYG